jgi:hypothetical protein
MEPSEALPITRASEFADEQFIASRHPFPISSQELIRYDALGFSRSSHKSSIIALYFSGI